MEYNNLIVPKFCWVCGKELKEVGLGWLQCTDDTCGEIYLPTVDKDGYQSLMKG